MTELGTLYGVGVGPGDPELLTLRAAAILQSVPVVSFIANAQGHSMSKSIVAHVLKDREDDDYRELPVVMPMCTDRDVANQVYDRSAYDIAECLQGGHDVAFLCEGDPMFFGSFAYLLARLQDRFNIQIVPGICSIHASAAQVQRPLGLLTDDVRIVSGRHSEEDLLRALNESDNVIVMKAGRPRARIVELICRAGRAADASYIEYATQREQRVVSDITQLGDDAGPYFSMFLVTKPLAAVSVE